MIPMTFYEQKEVRRLFSVRSLVTCFDVIRPADYYFAGEMHDFWEVSVVLEGSMSTAADERIYLLGKNQVIFHKPMEFHRLWSANETAPHLVIFSFEADGEGMRFFENKVFTLDAILRKQVKKIAASMTDALEHGRTNGTAGQEYTLLCHRAANEIEGFLIALYNTEQAKQQTVSQPSEDYRRIVRVLHENLHNPLTVSEIAHICQMSESSLKKRFFAYSGKSIGKYFLYMKIRRAILLLQDGESASEVSEKLGFSSVNYFYSAFKRETGLTPGQYLKKHKGI